MEQDRFVSWQELLLYLDEALELDPEKRDRWLATLEALRPRLAAELRDLLALHAANQASGFMEGVAYGGPESLIDQQIGAYRVERLLGRGGMGTVWLGRRCDGRFEGQAALKLLERVGPWREAGAYIQHEASLLARLTHPNIARLPDAGVRESGQPYT